MPACSSARRLAVLAVLLCGAMLFMLHHQTHPTSPPVTKHPAPTDAQNSTLGFSKILVLNTPARRDRLRNMQALARHHGLRFEYPGTVSRQEADRQAGSQGYLLEGTHLACYLSHLHALRHIVDHHVATALILEDDIDVEWDLKHLHARVMRQAAHVDWDMLFLGHCTLDANEPAGEKSAEVYAAEYPINPQSFAPYIA
ncbi:hypothetical protein IW150_002823 [Coemansia sp. RSA 2607]|nr:hypothetical protein IW150_002823 [Coemansia sp. RSA 2607]